VRLPLFGRFFLGFFFSLVFAVPVSLGQVQPASTLRLTRPSPGPKSLSGNVSVSYIGAYLSDGKFQADPRIAGSYTDGLASWRSDYAADLRIRPSEVPRFVDLHPRDRVIENYKPPAYAKRVVKGRFFLAWLRDDIITFAYGRERALLAPQHITVDSQGRVIVSDPAAGAVHVLDGNKSFRIAAGPDRRLHLPSGVAVDAEDNLYVADCDRGLVLVYDRNGNFLREIGRIEDETLFHSPTGIAIDRKNRHLYLLDTPRDVLFMLDLEGNVLKRVGIGRGHPIGRYASDATPLDLHEPTEITLGDDKLVVLDAGGSRIRIMDLQCNVIGQFNIQASTTHDGTHSMGLGIDSVGNLYVSSVGEPSVRVYDQAGRLRNSFGRPGRAAGAFAAPSGLWIDLMSRVYIADTDNHRVQVFQLAPSSPDPMGASE
jgi:DNA-binding beta-propeller fold protein YncE